MGLFKSVSSDMLNTQLEKIEEAVKRQNPPQDILFIIYVAKIFGLKTRVIAVHYVHMNTANMHVYM